jgi:LPS export ABC transporter protein LptC
LVRKFNFRIAGRGLIKYALLAMFLGFGWYGGWWDGLFRPTDRPKVAPARPAVPSENLYQTKLVGWNNHQKVWEIEADQIWRSADSNITYFKKVHSGMIFSIKGKQARFHAGWARWEKPWSVLYIGGRLVVKVDEYQFETKEVVMRYRNQEISCEDPVKLSGPHTLVQAKKMKLNFEKEEVLLEGDVRLAQNEDLVTTKALLFNLKEETYQLIEPGGIILNL